MEDPGTKSAEASGKRPRNQTSSLFSTPFHCGLQRVQALPHARAASEITGAPNELISQVGCRPL
jgi:hypothetical protein